MATNDQPPASPVTLRRYALSSLKYGGWAIFVIGSDGYFSVCSDYGNFAYMWGSMGSGVREFLAKIDGSYLVNKLSQGRANEYRAEETLQAVKKEILTLRRDRVFDAEDARDEWDLLASHYMLENEFRFVSWYAESRLEDCGQYYRSSPPSDAVAFCKHVFPRFQQLLKDELAAEATRT
jgi:hypothetical protein